MQHGDARTSNGTRSGDFTMGAAVATAAGVLGAYVDKATGSPLPLLVIPLLGCGVVGLAALAKWLRTAGQRDGPRLAGVVAGITLTLGTALVSRSHDLTPSVGLPVATGELGANSVIHRPGQPVAPLPIQSRPRSFLSHTHEPPVLRLTR